MAKTEFISFYQDVISRLKFLEGAFAIIAPQRKQDEVERDRVIMAKDFG